MLTTILTIVSVLIGLIGGIAEKHYEPEAIKKRDDYERDKELNDQDSAGISVRLSNAFDRLRLFNRKNR